MKALAIAGGLAWLACTGLPADELLPFKNQAEAIEQLFALEGTPESFNALLARARQAGLPEQVLREARFLFYAEHQDDSRMAAMAPELRAGVAGFDPELSQVFSTREAYLSAVFYAEALAALEKGDLKLFEHKVKEAFWYGPHQAGIFAETIESLRTVQAMEKVRLDLEREFPVQGEGRTQSLDDIRGDAKGLLLHFWSPWHRECELQVPKQAEAAKALKTQGVASAFVLVQGDEAQLPEARELMAALSECQVAWLMDAEQQRLASQLRIDRLPLSVLIDAEGRVLFHGDTGSEEMKAALKPLSQ